MYKDFIKQKKSNKCSIENGPNCFYIKGKNEKELYKDLNNIFHDNDLSVKENTSSLVDFYENNPNVSDNNNFSVFNFNNIGNNNNDLVNNNAIKNNYNDNNNNNNDYGNKEMYNLYDNFGSPNPSLLMMNNQRNINDNNYIEKEKSDLLPFNSKNNK